MAIGKKIIEWGEQEMFAGLTTAFDTTDGGFVPNTDAVNLTAVPGAVYGPAAPTDASTSLIGDMAASCPNGTTLSGQDKIFLAVDDSTKDGTYYYWNGTALTLKRTDSTNNYILGKAGIIFFDNEFYGVSNEAITRWTADDATFNVSWFTFAHSDTPHPVITFENNAFYGDGNLLKRQTAANSTPTTIVTFPVGTVITAFGIDPGSGNMLISTTSNLNASDTVPTLNKVYYYNGFSTLSIRALPVDEAIQAFYSLGGSVYCTYGQNFGVWTGSGVRFLRHLNVGFVGDELAYTGHITNNGSTLYIVEGRKLLAFGPVQSKGPNVFYYAYRNYVNTNNITHVTYLGQNILGIGFKSELFYKWSTSSVASSNTSTIWSKQYLFPDQYMITRAVIIFRDTYANGTSPGQIDIFNENTASIFSTPPTFTNTTGAATAVCTINNIMVKMYMLQFQLNLSSTTVLPGLRKIIFYGYPVNLPLSGQSS